MTLRNLMDDTGFNYRPKRELMERPDDEEDDEIVPITNFPYTSNEENQNSLDFRI